MILFVQKEMKNLYPSSLFISFTWNNRKRIFFTWKINDNYPKYVISMDEFDMSRKGIRHINIIDF